MFAPSTARHDQRQRAGLFCLASALPSIRPGCEMSSRPLVTATRQVPHDPSPPQFEPALPIASKRMVCES